MTGRLESVLFATLQILFVFAVSVVGANAADSGRVERVTVHGQSLESNVIGESADRWVSIYLPPGYDASRGKRFPVLFLLHGMGDSDEEWTESPPATSLFSIQEMMDAGIRTGRLGEMIVVMPNQRTRFLTTMYVDSSSSGRWDEFTSKELVAYVDTHYRTMARAESRAVAGHSMGGYGALSLAMRHPDIFQVVYAISPAMLEWTKDVLPNNPAYAQLLHLKDLPELRQDTIYLWAFMGIAQALSPNPAKPPFYGNLPFKMTADGLMPDEPGFSQWEAGFPINLAARYRENLRRLRAIGFDAGYEDQFPAITYGCRRFSDRLTSYGIAHVYEEYNGDHRNRLWGEKGRLYNDVLPFVSANVVRADQ